MKKTVFLISLLIVLSLVFSGMILAQAKKGGAVAATGGFGMGLFEEGRICKELEDVAGNDGHVSGAGTSRGISDNLCQ